MKEELEMDDVVYIVASGVLKMPRSEWISRLLSIDRTSLQCYSCKNQIELGKTTYSFILVTGTSRVKCGKCGKINLFYDSEIMDNITEWVANSE